MSGRTSYQDGTINTFENSFGAPIEADAIGNNMGFKNPYTVNPTPPGSGGSPEMIENFPDSPGYINGQPSCFLDYAPVKCKVLGNLPGSSINEVKTAGLSPGALYQLGIIEKATYIDTPGGTRIDPETGEEIITINTVVEVWWEISWNLQTQDCEKGKPYPRPRSTPTPKPTPSYPNCYTVYQLIYENKDIKQIYNDLWKNTLDLAKQVERDRSNLSGRYRDRTEGSEFGGWLFFNPTNYKVRYIPWIPPASHR